MYFNAIGRPFVEKKIRPLLTELPKGTRILDIGSGNGLAAALLQDKGFDIVPMDIHEGQYDDRVKPIVYDGKNIPFANDAFEYGIILTVLHHIDDPDAVLKEAARVCKNLVIMEDIYENKLQQYLTYFLDSLANLFYSPCPHTNKNDAGWRTAFQKLHLEVKHAQYRHVIFFIKQGIYTIGRK